MRDAFILDTCVLSEASKRKPNPAVLEFLDTTPDLNVPVAVVMELQLGMTLIAATDPVRAVRLSNWYQWVMSAGFPILDTTREVAETWGILAADARLKNLVVGHARAKHPRNGQDLHMAAFALTHQLPIATRNLRDFELIDECYPLPGLYDPFTARWRGNREMLFSEVEIGQKKVPTL